MDFKECSFCGGKNNSDAVKCEYCSRMFSDGVENAACDTPVLFDPEKAALWSFCFSPVFGSWCIWQNYKALNESKAAEISKYFTFGILGLIIFSVIFLPEKVINILSTVVLVAWYLIEAKKQKKFIRNNNIEYTKRKWKKPALIALAAIICYFVAMYYVLSLKERYDSYKTYAIEVINTKLLAKNSRYVVVSGNHKKVKYECVDITNIEKIGKNMYAGKAILESDDIEGEGSGWTNVTYEIIGDMVSVNIDPWYPVEWMND